MFIKNYLTNNFFSTFVLLPTTTDCSSSASATTASTASTTPCPKPTPSAASWASTRATDRAATRYQLLCTFWLCIFYFACTVTSQRAAEERGLPALPHVAVVREEKGEQEADAALLRRTVAALRGWGVVVMRAIRSFI